MWEKFVGGGPKSRPFVFPPRKKNPPPPRLPRLRTEMSSRDLPNKKLE